MKIPFLHTKTGEFWQVHMVYYNKWDSHVQVIAITNNGQENTANQTILFPEDQAHSNLALLF